MRPAIHRAQKWRLRPSRRRMLLGLVGLQLVLTLLLLQSGPALQAQTAGIGTISGTVRDAVTGAHLGGIIRFVAADGTYSWGGDVRDDGTYTIYGLLGEFIFHAGGCPYVEGFWRDKPDEASADRIRLGPGADSTDIDISLDLGGCVRGQVFDAEKLEPIGDPEAGGPGATLVIFPSTEPGRILKRAEFKGPEGQYFFGALPPGEYGIAVIAPGYQRQDLDKFGLDKGEELVINWYLQREGTQVTAEPTVEIKREPTDTGPLAAPAPAPAAATPVPTPASTPTPGPTHVALAAAQPRPKGVAPEVEQPSIEPTEGEQGLLEDFEILFAAPAPGGTDVFAMVADGIQRINLTSVAGGGSNPAWSPAGDLIAFTSERTGESEIWVMNADGTGQVNSSNAPGEDVHPTWSPDGSRIVFQSNRAGQDDIWTMNVDGSGQTNMTHDPAFDGYPDWSPDGSRIAFQSDRAGQDDIWVMNADGSGQTNVSDNPGHDTMPAWSPDGNRLAFASYRDGNYDIFVMNADGSGQAQLTFTDPPVSNHWPAWSPGGASLVFHSGRTGNKDIWQLDLATGRLTDLTDTVGEQVQPDWARAPSTRTVTQLFVVESGPKEGEAIRGFFTNVLPGESSPLVEEILDPVTLAVIGILVTIFATFIQLVRGR